MMNKPTKQTNCKFFRADTGELYELEVSSKWSISTVKEALAHLSQIQPSDQILLCDKYKLEDDKSFGHYNLPSNERPIFLFNRRCLQANAPLPRETVLGPVNVQIPPEQPFPQEAGLLGELLRYEHQFKSNLEYAKVRTLLGETISQTHPSGHISCD